MFANDTIHPPTVLRLLRGIDGLPAGASGALVFKSTNGNGPQGTILIDDRRVCWAAAADMEDRLNDLLRSQAGVTASATAFQEVFDHCYRKRRPLGKTLVRRELVSVDGLKRALRTHAAEAIARLSTGRRLTLGWTSNRVQTYDAEFSFGSVELMCSVGALGFEEVAVDAGHKLDEVTPEGSVGVAYFAEPGRLLPIAQVSAEGWASQSLVELVDWAREALSEQAPDESSNVLGSDTVHSLKRAWRSGELVLVRWTGDEEPAPHCPAEPFDLERETVLTR